ncbi:MAG: coenzyme F420-0:L-glutamate ligase / coenzyme F420:gamma-L-glutamate ligase [Solirubrobacteraceae bacterium]|nr:coenzyme F420-0:L-glutamate ligase / coenzyme F420:gamma-L-glutamate ligase [Solirubrobacteraceae bacterium]
MLTAAALAGLPEIEPGADLAALIATSITRMRAAADPDHLELTPGDVLVIAHKAVSKAEGRIRSLADVSPTDRARALARAHGKDPAHVQVILDESLEVIRAERGILICVTHHGFVCANAGVDASNAPTPGTVIMLPRDPDASARALRARLHELTGVRLGIVVTDSFGRAWRNGQCDVAIGCAGIAPLDDWRGRTDRAGRELHATELAAADELAAAADLARTKDGGEPVILVRGAHRHVIDDDGPGAAALIRPAAQDLFR